MGEIPKRNDKLRMIREIEIKEDSVYLSVIQDLNRRDIRSLFRWNVSLRHREPNSENSIGFARENSDSCLKEVKRFLLLVACRGKDFFPRYTRVCEFHG